MKCKYATLHHQCVRVTSHESSHGSSISYSISLDTSKVFSTTSHFCVCVLIKCWQSTCDKVFSKPCDGTFLQNAEFMEAESFCETVAYIYTCNLEGSRCGSAVKWSNKKINHIKRSQVCSSARPGQPFIKKIKKECNLECLSLGVVV
jgi:hypothetical protein